MEGTALQVGVHLDELSPGKLYSWLVAYLVTSVQRPEGSDKAETEVLNKIAALDKPKTADEDEFASEEESIVDLMAPPIPGLRESPAGALQISASE